MSSMYTFHELLQKKFEIIGLISSFDSNRRFFNNEQKEFLVLIFEVNLAKIDRLINEKIATDGHIYKAQPTTLMGEARPEN